MITVYFDNEYKCITTIEICEEYVQALDILGTYYEWCGDNLLVFTD